MVYESTETLAPGILNDPDGYWFEVRENARQTDYTNLDTPNTQKMTIGTFFKIVDNNLQPLRNSTPQISMPNPFTPVIPNDFFFHNLKPTDPNGDLLEFEFYTPFETNALVGVESINTPIPFDPLNPFPSGFPIQVSPSGIVKAQPINVGRNAYGVICKEKRGGEVVSETYLDLLLDVEQISAYPFTFNPPSPIEICSDNFGQTSISAAVPTFWDYQYYWYTGSFTNPSSEYTTYNIKPPSPGSYNLIVQRTNDCNHGNETAIVGSTPSPTATIYAITTEICPGACTPLTLLNPTSGFTHDWYRVNTDPLLPDDYLGTNSVNISVCQPGDYYVRVTDPSNSCRATSNHIILNPGVVPTMALTVPTSPFFCQGDIINITNSIPGNPPSLTYTPTWTGGNFNSNPNDYTFFDLDATNLGWQTFTLDAVGVPNSGCINSESHNFFIGTGNCCRPGLQVLDQAVINSGQTIFTGNYHITEDLLLDDNVYYEFSGEFYIQPFIVDFVSVQGSIIKLGTGTPMRIMSNSLFTSFCDEMWYGIDVTDGGKFFADPEVEISNAFKAIFSTSNDPLIIRVDGVNFFNNYTSVEGYGFATSINKYSVTNSTFYSDPSQMLLPYNTTGGWNDVFHSNIGIHILGSGSGGNVTDQNIYGNEFNNHITGIHFADASNMHISQNTFNGNKVAGISVDAGDLKISNSEIYVPWDLPNLPQIDEYFNILYPTISSAAYGIRILDGVDYEVYGCFLQGDEYISTDIQTNIGIRAPLKNPRPIISLNDFSFLNKAISTHSQGGIEILDNTFADNYKAISFTNPSTLTSVKFNCNAFSLDFTEPFDRYGLFIENGADIFTNFGGYGSSPFLGDPSGNNFPVNPDPNISIGYPTMAGPVGNPLYPNVAEHWQPVSNWFSIYDEVALLTGEDPVNYKYFAYYNEFVGENPNNPSDPTDAVVPSSVVYRVDDQNSPLTHPDYLGQNNITCNLSPIISFPASRITHKNFSGLAFSSTNSISTAPNPVRDQVRIISNTEPIKKIVVLNTQGRKVIEKEFSDKEFLDLKSLPSGIYLINISFISGKKEIVKILRIDK
jgi:Secretion system C-terminal sorting domain